MFGSLLDKNGFPSVPSLRITFPEPYEEYFGGGYNTNRHGSRNNGGEIDAIQVELNRDIRIDPIRREMLINALTTSANQYIDLHYNDQYLGVFCNLILSNSNLDDPKHNFIIYPNPAKDYLKIKGDITEIEIEIYNSLGQKLHSEMWSGTEIEIGFLANGFYIIQLKKGNMILGSVKFVKN